MVTFLTILVALSMLATLGVLLSGVLGMSGSKAGGERSNKLMRWRIGLQALTLVLFVSSLVLFSRVLLSINLSVAYATWSAAGIIATTAASLVIFHDELSTAGGVGIVLLVIGVVLVNL